MSTGQGLFLRAVDTEIPSSRLAFTAFVDWSTMFDCQNCSLASITFLIQLFGLVVAVGFRLRSQASVSNLAGLMIGILMMAASCMVCLFIEPSLGIVQGVTLVAVAIGATISFGDQKSVTF